MAATETKAVFATADKDDAKDAGKALVLVSIEGKHLRDFPFRSYERLLELTPAQAAKVVAFAEQLAMEAAGTPT